VRWWLESGDLGLSASVCGCRNQLTNLSKAAWSYTWRRKPGHGNLPEGSVGPIYRQTGRTEGAQAEVGRAPQTEISMERPQHTGLYGRALCQGSINICFSVGYNNDWLMSHDWWWELESFYWLGEIYGITGVGELSSLPILCHLETVIRNEILVSSTFQLCTGR